MGREGAYRIGERHPRCTVPDVVVVQMRDLHEDTRCPLSAYKIARLLGYPVSTVKKIVYYQRRHFVPLPPDATPE